MAGSAAVLVQLVPFFCGQTTPGVLLNSNVLNAKPAAPTLDVEKNNNVVATSRDMAIPWAKRRNKRLMIEPPCDSSPAKKHVQREFAWIVEHFLRSLHLQKVNYLDHVILKKSVTNSYS